MRQIIGVFSQLKRTRLVKKLKAARERKKASGKGRYIGCKSHMEKRPDVVAEAKRLYCVNPKAGDRRSLREISTELEFAGFFNDFGKPNHPQSIQRMIRGRKISARDPQIVAAAYPAVGQTREHVLGGRSRRVAPRY